MIKPSVVAIVNEGHVCATCCKTIKGKQGAFIVNLIDATGPHVLCLSCLQSLRRDIDALKLLIETGIDTNESKS